MWRLICKSSGAIILGSLLVLGIVAATNAASVHEFSEIQASPVTVTPDASGRFATLEVDTSVDVACSVVYGTDESFGLIAVDNDMDGGAHADHHPIMAGLEPDTEYLYRLQGTAADGSIYISEVMSFLTPTVEAGGRPNLALVGTVSGVSSEWSEQFAGANAFDADPTTEWSSRGDGDEAWIEIDLGSPQAISEVLFVTRSMGDGSATTTNYMLSADGNEIGTFSADEPFVQSELVAQVLRFDVQTSTGGNTGAVEILVLGEEP